MFFLTSSQVTKILWPVLHNVAGGYNIRYLIHFSVLTAPMVQMRLLDLWPWDLPDLYLGHTVVLFSDDYSPDLRHLTNTWWHSTEPTCNMSMWDSALDKSKYFIAYLPRGCQKPKVVQYECLHCICLPVQKEQNNNVFECLAFPWANESDYFTCIFPKLKSTANFGIVQRFAPRSTTRVNVPETLGTSTMSLLPFPIPPHLHNR